MPPLRPSDFANQRLYADYYSTYADDYPMAGWPTWKSGEHNAILNFVRKNTATHIFATNDGWWNVATNWAVWNGSGWMTANTVPGANAQVVIGEGVTCTFNSGPNATTTDLYWIRIDGTLKFPVNANAHLVVDTIVTTPNSYFEMGTLSNPLPHQHTINIEFSTARGWVNTNTDFSFSSRGIIWMGNTHIEGTKKTIASKSFTNVACLIGATSVALENVPSYWNVGDRITIAGTRPCTWWTEWPPVTGNNSVYNPSGWQDPRIRWSGGPIFKEYEEETVTITSITGNVVSFTPAARYNHLAPENPWQANMPIKPWIRNLTRNIRFSSKNAANIYSTPIAQRAHSMVMHNPNTQIGWCEFTEMGRTAKMPYGIAQIFLGNGEGGNNAWLGFKSNVPVYLPQNNHPGGGMTLFYPSQIEFPGIYTNPSGGTVNFRIEGFGPDRITPLTETISIRQEDRVDAGVTNLTNTSMRLGVGDSHKSTSNLFGVITRITPWAVGVANGANLTTSQREYIIGTIGRTLRIGSSIDGFPGSSAGFRIPRGSAGSSQAANWVYFPVNPFISAQGRYAFHIHRMGTSHTIQRFNPAARGVVVSGTVGWGFAHHDSHFSFVDCIAHRCGGAGFVAESGNETGIWLRCHSTNIIGRPDSTHKDGQTTVWGEIGFMGSAFWFTGRAVKAVDCVADNAYGGYVYNGRFAELNIEPDALDFPETMQGGTSDFIDIHPLLHFYNTEAFAMGHLGLIIIKNSSPQSHGARTLLGPMKIWTSWMGAEITYTGQYTMQDFLHVWGDMSKHNPFIGPLWPRAFINGTNNIDQVWVRPRVSGHRVAMHLDHSTVTELALHELADNHPDHYRIVVDPDFRNMVYDAYFATLFNPAFNWVIDYRPGQDRIVLNANTIITNTTPNIHYGYEEVGYVQWHNRLSYANNSNIVLQTGPSAGQTVNPATLSNWFVHGWSPHMNVANYPLGASYFRQGIFSDRLGTDRWPLGQGIASQEDFSIINWYDWTWRNITIKDGIWQHTDGAYYFFQDELYSDRFTGDVYKRCIPYRIGANTSDRGLSGWWDFAQHVRGTININNKNRPNATNINVTVQKGSVATIKPTDFANGNNIVYWGSTKPRHGMIVPNGTGPTSSLFGDGTIRYIPPGPDFVGYDEVRYWVRDRNGNLQSDYGNFIRINVVEAAEIGPAMILSSDSANTVMNNVVAFNVLTNDQGVGLRLNSANVNNIARGNVTTSSNGRILFTPGTDYFGTASGWANIENSTNSIAFSSWVVTITQPNVANVVANATNTFNTTVPYIPGTRTMRLFNRKSYPLNIFRDIVPDAFDRENQPLYVTDARSSQFGAILERMDIDSNGALFVRARNGGNVTIAVEIQNASNRKNTLNVNIVFTDKGSLI